MGNSSNLKKIALISLLFWISACGGSVSNPVDALVGNNPVPGENTNSGGTSGGGGGGGSASVIVITPQSATIAPTTTQQFVASGGTTPYSYSILLGSGTISSSGLYTAPGTGGVSIIRVNDANGSSSLATVTVTGSGGSTATLSISPTNRTIAVGNSVSYVGSGGTSPYSYSVLAGGVGTVHSSTGVYSSVTDGTAVIRITDAVGATANTNVTVNPALSLPSSTRTLSVNDTLVISPSGGVAPYSYALVSGVGNLSGNTYTAPSTSGAANIRVTDSLGNQVNLLITINPTLALSPVTRTLAVSTSTTFTASGGVPPYTYSIFSGGGSLSGAVYTAASTTGTALVRVTDSVSNTANSNVSIVPALSLNETTLTLALNNSFTFVASGGVPPYSYSKISGVGSISVVTGVYSATSVGSSTVRVMDSDGNSTDATITVNGSLGLAVTPSTISLGNSATLAASGGVSPYTYSIVSGGGSISGTTFTAGGSSGSVIVQAQDSRGNTTNSTITINTGLSISPIAKSVVTGGTVAFSAAGGVSPYVYSVVSGGSGGTLSGAVYTAPGVTGSDTIRVTDNLGNTTTTTVAIVPALVISPLTTTIGLNNTTTFTATGGVSPYTFTKVSGIGSINAVSGIFNGSSSGSAVIRVTDSDGNTSDANVTVSNGLTLSVDRPTLAVNNSATLTASGGVSPYSYSVVSGTGTISGTTFTAPSTAGSTTIRATDALNNTADTVITIQPALTVSPTSRSLTTTNTFTFLSAGGVTPHSFSIVSGPGSIGSTTGIFTPAGTGTTTIRVTDALNNIADATASVVASISLSPATSTLTILGNQTFTPSGGVTPYVFSVASGGVGTVHPTTGIYTAPSSAGTATVVVTDAVGNTANSVVTVNANLTISPSSRTLAVSNTHTFTGVGGIPPYTYTLQSGGGTVNSSTGLYTAPVSSGSAVVRVTDAATSTATANITINPALSVSPSSFGIVVNNTRTLTVSGGVPPYSYATNQGSISAATSTTATFTAPSLSGSATITVTDALGNTVTSTATINDALQISPTSTTLASGSGAITRTFSATGGAGTNVYSTTIGTINSSTGVLTPPTSGSGSGTVTVTDSAGNTSSATVTLNAPLTISPSSRSIAINETFSFSSTGGVAPVTFSVFSGLGSMTGTTYNAPGSTGSASVRATDSLGNVSSSSVTIVNVLSISPSNPSLAVNNQRVFAGSGGVSPYTFSVVAGGAGGTINASTGTYTAPATVGSGSDTIRVTDAHGRTADTVATIVAALQIIPATRTIITGDRISLGASGGVPPYTYTMQSGTGTISSEMYFSSLVAGNESVRVTDSLGNTSTGTYTLQGSTTIDDFILSTGYGSHAHALHITQNSDLFVAGRGDSASGRNWVVRRSTDGGSNWATVDTYQRNSGFDAEAYALASSTSGGITTVYAVGYARDTTGVQRWIVRRSLDNGTTWSTLEDYQSSAITNSSAMSIAVDGAGNILVGGRQNSNDGMIRRSTGGGAFSSVYTATANGGVPQIEYFSGTTFWAATPGMARHLRSTDSGANWSVRGSATFGGRTTLVNAIYSMFIRPAADNSPQPMGFTVDSSENIIQVHTFRDGVTLERVDIVRSTDLGISQPFMVSNHCVGTCSGASPFVGTAFPSLKTDSGGNLYALGITSNASGQYFSTLYKIFTTLNGGHARTLEQFQLSSGQNAWGGWRGLGMSGTNLYMAGTALNASALPRWFVRRNTAYSP